VTRVSIEREKTHVVFSSVNVIAQVKEILILRQLKTDGSLLDQVYIKNLSLVKINFFDKDYQTKFIFFVLLSLKEQKNKIIF